MSLVFTMSGLPERWSVVGLFSGAGGMSYGFHAHPAFSIVGAADAQIGKPSTSSGTLGCNATYLENIGLSPIAVDLATVDPEELAESMGLTASGATVLCACPPCTGFSRTSPQNHIRDDSRNYLVGRIPEFAKVLQPKIALTNMYRHIGDAVPPLISYQLAALCRWILTGERPVPAQMLLPGCILTIDDIEM